MPLGTVKVAIQNTKKLSHLGEKASRNFHFQQATLSGKP
tara:strand:+ start:208 stop:324 length:117 start_codon:yes stop_codon:yes gene_type:complete